MQSYLQGRNPLLLSFLSAGILTLCWPHIAGLVFLVFVGFVPLFMLEEGLYQQRDRHHSKRSFLFAFIGLLLWNIGTTYFILYIREPESSPFDEFIARLAAGGLTYITNAALMAIVFWLFHLTRRNLGDRAGYTGLVLYWLSFEYLHMHWSINWPWLNLGNVFAHHPWAVQWYEYTGSPGGTLWILLTNVLAFHALKSWIQGNKARAQKITIATSMVLLIPLLISYTLYSNYEEQGEAAEIVLVQPNLDPYETKFTTDPFWQLELMLSLADSADSDNTRFYVLPETALQEGARIDGRSGEGLKFSGLWEHTYNDSRSVDMMRKFLKDKDAAIVAGAADREYYKTKETISARYIEDLDIYYENYNSTLLVTDQGVEKWYRKSKLVPGVESIPFVTVLSFLDDLALDLGGASGSLGTQETREVFEYDGLALSPTICYESIFGEFNTEFIVQGSEAIFISTNDSWWQDSPGYRQLLDYGRLRAIETRKGIARSANTGITCFIDQKGDITSAVPWWTVTALKGTVHFNDVQTFYTRHGDYISRVAAFVAVMLLLWTLVKPLRDRYAS
jgi:apolipoprotein N-acyltransferase